MRQLVCGLFLSCLYLVSVDPIQAQSTFYFPRVVATTGTATGIAISNPTALPATVTLTYFDKNGGTIANPATVSVSSAGQIARLSTELFPNSENQSGWVRLNSDVSNITGFYLNGDFVTSSDGGEFAPAGTSLVFPWIAHQGTMATELTLTNVTNSAMDVQMTLYDGAGKVVRTGSVSLGARAQSIATVASLLQIDEIGLGYLRAEATGAMIGAEIVRDGIKDIALLNARLDVPAMNLVFPHIATGGGYVTSIFVQNITSAPVDVTFAFFLDNGTPGASSRAVTVMPGELFRESVSNLFSLTSSGLVTGWVQASAAANSLEGFQVFTATDTGGVTALPARRVPSTRLMQSHIAEQTGAISSPTDLFTGLAVLNPSDTSSDVTVSIVTRDGSQLADYAVTLAAREKRALLLREMMLEVLGETSGTVWIRSSRPVHALQIYGTWNLALITQIPAQSTESVFQLANPRTDLYTITGTISAPPGMIPADITVDTTGPTNRSVRTDYQGRFAIKSVAAGTYVLRPLRTGLFFTPQTTSISVLRNIRNVSFSAAIDSPGGGGPLTVDPEVVEVRVISPVPVGAYQVKLRFNPGVLQLSDANVSGGDAPFNSRPITVNIDNTAGEATLNDFKTTPSSSGTVVVARLRFTGISAGSSALSVLSFDVTNANGDTVPSASIALSSSQLTVR